MKLVSYKDKLPPLQEEAEQIKKDMTTFINLLSIKANRDLCKTALEHLSRELSRVHNQIYMLVTTKPVFIEDDDGIT